MQLRSGGNSKSSVALISPSPFLPSRLRQLQSQAHTHSGGGREGGPLSSSPPLPLSLPHFCLSAPFNSPKTDWGRGGGDGGIVNTSSPSHLIDVCPPLPPSPYGGQFSTDGRGKEGPEQRSRSVDRSVIVHSRREGREKEDEVAKSQNTSEGRDGRDLEEAKGETFFLLFSFPPSDVSVSVSFSIFGVRPSPSSSPGGRWGGIGRM